MVNSGATTKNITQKVQQKISLRKLKCYFRKYSFRVKESSEREKEEQNRHKAQKTKSKMADVNSTISIITLNVNGLNNPIKRQRLSN